MANYTVKYVVHTAYLVPVEAESAETALAWVAVALNEDVEFMGIPLATETTLISATPAGKPVANVVVRAHDYLRG